MILWLPESTLKTFVGLTIIPISKGNIALLRLVEEVEASLKWK